MSRSLRAVALCSLVMVALVGSAVPAVADVLLQPGTPEDRGINLPWWWWWCAIFGVASILVGFVFYAIKEAIVSLVRRYRTKN